ncbi:MAG: GNAT family N-acetyltransferase, partial [Prevotella sp.]|nr:GNAT family N-acetyltransferase [Prevotella sp.]
MTTNDSYNNNNSNSNVILRAIEPDDLDLLYNVENDRTLWQLGNTNEPYSKELLRNYILTTTGDIYADKQLRLIIELE